MKKFYNLGACSVSLQVVVWVGLRLWNFLVLITFFTIGLSHDQNGCIADVLKIFTRTIRLDKHCIVFSRILLTYLLNPGLIFRLQIVSEFLE